MIVTVLCGSPKKQPSITRQYVDFVTRSCVGHSWRVRAVGAEITRYERDPAAFEALLRDVRDADIVIWAFPVYTFCVPSQLKRFVELLFERGAADAFRGRHAFSLATSEKIFDHSALAWVEAVSGDLGLRYLGGLSYARKDLLDRRIRRDLATNARRFLDDAARDVPGRRAYEPVAERAAAYVPTGAPTTPTEERAPVVLLVDGAERHGALAALIDTFQGACRAPVEVVDWREHVRSPCRGCMSCLLEGVCAVRDGYNQLFEEVIDPAACLVFADRIRARYLSAGFKRAFDRFFFRGHDMGLFRDKAVGFLLSGPLRQLPELRQALRGYLEYKGAASVRFASDDGDNAPAVTAEVAQLADNLVRDVDDGTRRPRTFLGEGVRAMLVNFVYRTNGLLLADHENFRRHGYYAFPNTDLPKRVANATLRTLLRVPAARRSVGKHLTRLAVLPHRTLLPLMETFDRDA